MGRGHRRLSRRRPHSSKTPHGPVTVAGGQPAFGVRSLAVNALALTGVAASVLVPAHGITLGELAVESSLGQPLSARVPVQLGPGEFLSAACISMPSAAAPQLTVLPRPAIGVPETAVPGSYDLRITTTRPLYEPMYELQLQVRCPGTALVVRQYVLMLDLPGAAVMPAGPEPALIQAQAQAQASAAPAAVAAAPTIIPQRAARARSAAAPRTLIEPGKRYRVATGDTLSTIAARVSGRGSTNFWALADQIFAANPEAFIGANPDLIKLGSEIVIPVAGTAPAIAASPGSVDLAPEAAAATAPEPSRPAETVSAPPLEATADDTSPPQPAPALSEMAVADAAPAEPMPAVADAIDTPAPAPVFQDEPAARAAAATEAPAIAAPASAAQTDSDASAWLAGLVGVLVGAAISLLLLRERLIEALRALLPRKARAAQPTAAPESARPASSALQVAPRMLPPESTMLVVEGRHEEADDGGMPPIERIDPTPTIRSAVVRSHAEDSLDSDLSRLFGDEPDVAAFDEPEISALPSAGELDLDLDLSAATPDGQIDEDISWIGDDTSLTPTQQVAPTYESSGSTAEQVDLQTLSRKATADEQISQTLKDALSLLESDYEDELTASQVIDKSKLKELLDEGAEDTLIRTGTGHNPRR